MKKHLPIILFFFFVMPAIWANDINYEITQEQSVSQIQNDLQNAIDNAAAYDKIIVTGSKTNADATLFLNIPEDKTVVWKATYQAASALNPLISLSDNGTFEVSGGTLVTTNGNTMNSNGTGSTIIVGANSKVQTSGAGVHAITTEGNVEIKEGAEISGTTGEVIETTGYDSMITMSGGSVTVTSENAINARGINAKVFVSGGILSNMAPTDPYPVIFMSNKENNQLNVQVSGTAKVTSSGKGFGIYSYGNVEISGNACISATDNHAIYTGGSDSKITISGESKIETTGSYPTIWTLGSGVEVRDYAQVIATKHLNAITSIQNSACMVTVSGGLVFAITSNIFTVISAPYFMGPIANGVVLAWNNEAGTTNYEIMSADDIQKLPESATAYWDKKGNLSGISYAMGDNTGFIPLDVEVVLSVKESILSNITIFPNPTTGELKVESGELKVDNVEIFDVYGRKLSSNHLISKSSNHQINISHLPAGIYFLRVNEQTVKVIKN
jgi:hypothetical protein